MSCDLCGKQAPTKLVKIEGIAYTACSDCARYGTEIREAPPKRKHVKKTDDRVVVRNAGTMLRKAREGSGKSMEDFAKMLSVKESDLHAWETGHRTPTVETAERLQKRLHIDLLERAPAEDHSASIPKRSSGGGMTIADMLKKN